MSNQNPPQATGEGMLGTLFYSAPEAWRYKPDLMLPYLLRETGLRFPELLAQMRALNLKWLEKPEQPQTPQPKVTPQKGKFQVQRRKKPPSPREGEVLYLLRKQGPLHPRQLAGILQLPLRTCRNILRGLARAGWADHQDLSYFLTKSGAKQAALFGEVAVRIGKVSQEDLRAESAAKSQSKLLEAMTSDVPENCKEIALKVGVCWHWASRILRKLEKQGLVEKVNTPGIGVFNRYIRKNAPET